MSNKNSLAKKYKPPSQYNNDLQSFSNDDVKTFKSSSDGEVHEKSGSKEALRFALLLGAVAVCFVLILISWNMGKKHISPEDFVQLTYTGANGYATAECTIDVDGVVAKLVGKGVDEAKERLYVQLANNIKGSVTTGGNISNGDRITVNITYDKELANAAGVTVGNTEFVVRAKDIPAGTQVDLFENIEVIFAGISPDAYVVIKNEWDDRFLSQLSFVADKQKNITANDEITIRCEADEAELGQHGYTADTFEKTYTADRLSSYVERIRQIDSKVVETLKEQCVTSIQTQTEDTTFRMIYRATGNRQYLYLPNDESAENITFLEAKFLDRNEDTSSELAKNKIVLIFSAEIVCDSEVENVYFGYTFENGYITADGTFNVLNGDSEAGQYICNVNYDEMLLEIMDGSDANYTMYGI
jgi:hypothetical protein